MDALLDLKKVTPMHESLTMNIKLEVNQLAGFVEKR